MKDEFNDKEFDDALRSKSLEYHPLPSPDIWERIDYSIADAEEKKSRRKLLYFRWLTGILLIFSSTLLLYIFVDSKEFKNTNGKNHLAGSKNLPQLNVDTHSISENSISGARNNKELLSNTDTHDNNFNIAQEKNDKANNLIVNNNQSHLNNEIFTKLELTNSSTTKKNITETNAENIGNNTSIFDTTTSHISQTLQLNIDSSKLLTPLVIMSDSAFTTSDSSMQLIPLIVEKKDSLINEILLSTIEMDSILKPKKSRWSFGLSVLPMLTSIRVTNSQDLPSNSTYKPTKEFNQPFGIIAGANVLFDLNNKLSIYGGINYYERFVHSEFSNIYVKNSPATYQSFNTIGGSTRLAKTDIQPFFDMNFGVDSIAMNIDIKNRYYFLNVPISLRYQALNKRVQISFLFGATVNYFFMRKTSAFVYDLSTGESKTLYPQNQIAYEKFHFGLQGGMEIGYNFKKSIIYLSPTYAYSISPFVKGSSGAIYPIGYGLGLGFRYHL